MVARMVANQCAMLALLWMSRSRRCVFLSAVGAK